MEHLFFGFLKDPTQDKYLELRRALIDSAVYQPHTTQLRQLLTLYEQGRLEDVPGAGEMVKTNYLLSPTLHFLLGKAYGLLGDRVRENLERVVFVRMRDALLATGDGSSGKPYLVTHIDDEFDVLGFRQLEAKLTSLVKHEDGRFFDVVTCTDETEVWFDITDVQRWHDRVARESRPEDQSS